MSENSNSQAPKVADPTSVDENAVIIKSDGELAGDIFKEGDAVDVLVSVEKDVYEEFYFPGTKRPAQRLLYPAGTQVKKSDLERLNASRKAAAAPVEPVIDSTTAPASDEKADENPAAKASAKDSAKK